jgi:sphinganine-1-phosphate aldolase
MTTTLKADKFLARMPPRLANSLYRLARHVPPLSKYIERELEQVLEGVSDSLKPYRTSMPSYLELPPTGRSHSAILDELHTMHDAEAKVWQSGKVSGAVYHGHDLAYAWCNTSTGQG